MSNNQKWAERAAELAKFSESIDQRMRDLASWRRVWAKELAEREPEEASTGQEPVIYISAAELMPPGTTLPSGACSMCGGCGRMTTCDRWDPRASEPCPSCDGAGLERGGGR